LHESLFCKNRSFAGIIIVKYNPPILAMERNMEEIKPTGEVQPVDAAAVELPAVADVQAPDPSAHAPDAAVQAPMQRVAHKRFSWRSVFPWVASIALVVVGMVIGYFGRPLIVRTPTVPTGSDAQAPIISLLLSNVRHFRGNANAPVTIIELSDFQ
jgi:hypothetical protein